jgi:hypothetical protein
MNQVLDKRSEAQVQDYRDACERGKMSGIVSTRAEDFVGMALAEEVD